MKKVLRLLLLIVLLPLLYVGGVIAVSMATDYDPPPTTTVKVEGEGQATIDKDTLGILTWNIGYGGLGRASDFFYDGGKMVRMPKDTVKQNIEGVKSKVKELANEVDFFLLQEVDLDAKRSHGVNQMEEIAAVLPNNTYAFGTNYDVTFVPLPFTNPLGGVLAGLTTYGKYTPTEATRYSFKGNYDWPTYLFFLDRCFLLERFPLKNGKELVVVNTHNSAYDDGTLKQKQMDQMKEVLIKEYKKGNYVIVGGDWNQIPPEFKGVKGFELKENAAKMSVPTIYPEAGWHWAVDPTIATNRSLEKPFDQQTTSRSVIDFFLLSPNVETLSVKGLEMNFTYSDHQPVFLQVKLSDDSLEPDSEQLPQ